MNQIKISVIIPIYNVENYLAQCLDSIINQTLREIEIICINDGSKDSSLEILRDYQKRDSRIKIIDKENQGISVSRNIGLEMSSGDFVSFIDSDDWISTNFYENLYNAALKYDCDIACSSIIRATKNSKRKKLCYKKFEYSNDNDKKNKLTHTPVFNYVWNKIYKREKLLKYHLTFPSGRVFEDICWSIKAIYYSNGLVTVPDCEYYYRKNPKSVVSIKSEKQLSDCLLSEKEMLDFAKEKNLKISPKYRYTKRDRVKFFGVTIMKIFYYYPNIAEYCLFGVVPILRAKIKEKK